jgi:hypothetical protein
MGMVRRAVQRRTSVQGLMSGPGTSLARHEAASPSQSPTARRLTHDAQTRALSGGGPNLGLPNHQMARRKANSTPARMAAAGPLFSPSPSPFASYRGMSPFMFNAAAKYFVPEVGEIESSRHLLNVPRGFPWPRQGSPASLGTPAGHRRLSSGEPGRQPWSCAATPGALPIPCRPPSRPGSPTGRRSASRPARHPDKARGCW